MASYSLHSYSIYKSSSDRSAPNDRRDMDDQVIGPMRGTSSSFTCSDSGSDSIDRDERVRLGEPMVENKRVESPASSNNVEDVNEVNPPDDDWVVEDVRTTYSKYMTIASLRVLVDIQDIVDSSVPDGAFSLGRCLPTDRVFHGRGSSTVDFFFMYARVTKDSCIVIPFDNFCSDVLRFLNVAPTQLHSNSWAYIRAFQFVCSTLAITSTIPLFFSHYLT